MCGRFTVTSEKSYLEDRFSAKFVESFLPRFNAAPSQKLPVITNDNVRKIQMFSWGLRPEWWRKTKGNRSGIINVRMETLRDRWTFKKDLNERRCLVLADGFYEWSRTNGKQPFRFIIKNEEPFVMAGIWEINHEAGKELYTFSIITCAANQKMAPVHNRMPVILAKNEENIWLGKNDKYWLDLLDAYPSRQMEMYPVSKEVNSPVNDNPGLIVPLED